jgi:DNA-binding winged helix-turn-helix (wHTH) protein
MAHACREWSDSNGDPVPDSSTSQGIRLGDVVHFPDTFELRHGNVATRLEPRISDFLCFLVGNRNRVVSKDELLAHVWQQQFISDSAIFRCVYLARRALSGRDWIEVVRGRGYRWTGPSPEPLQTASGHERVARSTQGQDHYQAIADHLRAAIAVFAHSPELDPGMLCTLLVQLSVAETHASRTAGARDSLGRASEVARTLRRQHENAVSAGGRLDTATIAVAGVSPGKHQVKTRLP